MRSWLVTKGHDLWLLSLSRYGEVPKKGYCIDMDNLEITTAQVAVMNKIMN